MATEYYEIRHCGRIVISSAWNFCPFCGGCLHCDGNLASEPFVNPNKLSVSGRLATSCCQQRLDRSLRANLITGKLTATGIASEILGKLSLEEMEK